MKRIAMTFLLAFMATPVEAALIKYEYVGKPYDYINPGEPGNYAWGKYEGWVHDALASHDYAVGWFIVDMRLLPGGTIYNASIDVFGCHDEWCDDSNPIKESWFYSGVSTHGDITKWFRFRTDDAGSLIYWNLLLLNDPDDLCISSFGDSICDYELWNPVASSSEPGTWTMTVVHEPGLLALLGLSWISLGFTRRRARITHLQA